MSINTAKSIIDLKKRVSRFLTSDKFAREEIREVIKSISPLGEIVIFGGAIRDIALRGNEYFPNDVDMVIASSDVESLEDALKKFRVKTNRFGGYRITLDKWKVDLWPFDLTWAIKEGYVQGKEFRDLLKTTFFDWDAILFDLSSGAVIAEDGYIEKLQSRIVDLNLEPNPNPIGATVRTLRFYVSGNGQLGSRLTNYLCQKLEQEDLKTLLHAERTGYVKPILTEANISNVMSKLNRHIAENVDAPFGAKLEQLSLI